MLFWIAQFLTKLFMGCSLKCSQSSLGCLCLLWCRDRAEIRRHRMPITTIKKIDMSEKYPSSQKPFPVEMSGDMGLEPESCKLGAERGPAPQPWEPGNHCGRWEGTMGEGSVGESALKMCMSACPVHAGFGFQHVADMGWHVLCELCNLVF